MDTETLTARFLEAWFHTPGGDAAKREAAYSAVKALGLNPNPGWKR